jgi:DNA-binding transcriptional regulator LsrR (DeoR family)
MPRPKKQIPLNDIKGLKTLLDEGCNQDQIAAYYGVDQATISRRIQELRENKT